MDSPVVRSRGRPRKRRREDVRNGEIVDENVNKRVVQDEAGNKNVKEDVQITGNVRKRGRPPKKRAVVAQGLAMVGRYVLKDFEGSGFFLGKIVSYDAGLYRVEYEDGDSEDLDSGELREYVIGEEREGCVDKFAERKVKLDEHVALKMGWESTNEAQKAGDVKSDEPVASKMDGKLTDEALKEGDMELVIGLEHGSVDKARVKPVGKGKIDDVRKSARKVEVPTLSELSGGDKEGGEVVVVVDDDDDDDDSSSDSCEYGLGWETRSETETPGIPPPQLPPSSGNVAVPEEYVSNLFSVYGFLRSFSIRLFLSPFTLDDLVGCLNCTIPSTLLDSIHVALLRALRRHLETLASDGSEIASKCLRCSDWSLLDMLTWPVYLVHYLMVMGHLNGDEWKGFCNDVLEKDYCTLSVGMKLTVLQILCDDALDTAEVRAEIDMREGSEVGLDSDGITYLDSEPRKVPLRHCKNSVTKDRVNTVVGTEIALPSTANSLTMKGNDNNRDVANIDEDENVDECRLCGMDGVLLCCDGCPSAYHSRCIGVNKLSIPEGNWFCPECTISKIGPTIMTGTSLKGAEVFGIDSYAQLFLGTCDHLLVLKVSVKTSHFVRYYNRNDIVKVVTLLCASPHHAVLYNGICQAILKYWGLPLSIIPPVINNQSSMAQESRYGVIMHPVMENGSDKVCQKVEHDNYAFSLGENFVDTASGTSIEKLNGKLSSGDASPGVPLQTGVSLGVQMQTFPASVAGMSGAMVNQNPTNLTSKLTEQAELSCPTRQALGDKSSVTGIAPYTSRHNSSSTAGHQTGVSLPGNPYLHGKGVSDGVGRRMGHKWNDTCSYMGSFFKAHAYINHFVHGEYAGTAAANFAVLSSEENRPSELRASDPRKAMSAIVALQAKAFASATFRFFWPSTEKKLVEVPRERCSWCLHCKASVTSKKACLLNQAALNATRMEMKFVSGHRLTRNVDGAMYGIATYTLYMEESLRGLIFGPFRFEGYRKQWRKEVEQASTCRDLKFLLLELEGNIRSLAFSTEWTKLVDNWMDESSVPQSACPIVSTQKRGPGRRKKHLALGDVTSDDSNDTMTDTTWWRGGKLTKVVFQRATLPSSVLRKMARQGGSRRIPGVYYADGFDVPKRSRQFLWRAAVEMASNSSQLALQVRYLDNHLKWSELVRPEQIVLEGKGSETEASVFRNALICDKKVVENKIIYGVVFGHQKHLSSRLMKSIIEKEENEDGKDKYWFSEARVPLYLIKEYEENTEKALPSRMNEIPKTSPPVSKLQQKQLKASRKNIFCYLDRRRDNLYMCLCASCHQDVVINYAAKCSACEGYCHKECTMSSTVITDEDVEFTTICKLCSHVKVAKNNCGVESPTSPLAVQGQDYQNSATVSRSGRSKSTNQQNQNSATVAKSTRSKSTSQQLPPIGTSETPDKQPALSDSNKSKKRSCHWGLIWRKKNREQDGSTFRLRNLLFRGNLHDGNALNPICYLCKSPYNHNLTYIFCEVCEHWYHADAVELDESRIHDLVGFKCCRCRRIKSPICPYGDPPNAMNSEVKKLCIKGPREGPVPPSSASEAMSEQAESVPSTPMSLMEEDILIQVDDGLMLSVSEVDQMHEPKAELEFDWNATSGPGPQKLPVRRHVKNEKDDVGFASNPSLDQFPTYAEMKNIANPPQVEWDVPNGGGDLDGMTFDYEDINYEENADYEPQTYFSFTELLEADDSNHPEGANTVRGACENIPCENIPCENSQTGLLEQCEIGSNVDDVPVEFLNPETSVACNICSQTVPSPDLYCHNCGIQIHSHCSPWEKCNQGENWACGNCRGWC